MSQQQQFAAAADILTSAWVKIENSDQFPPDSLIRRFQQGVSDNCAPGSAVITDVTYLIYQSDSTFRP